MDCPTVLNGVIDLVHRSRGGWKIVDYKTDRDAVALPAKYAGQIADYERAWRRCEKRLGRCWLEKGERGLITEGVT